MSKPMRIQLSRRKGWKMPPNTVKADRATGFGNPFRVHKATSIHMGAMSDIWIVGTWNGPAMWIKDSRAEAVQLSIQAFDHWIKHPQQRQQAERAKKTLRGKNLACWCKLSDACHADVLLDLANPAPPGRAVRPT